MTVSQKKAGDVRGPKGLPLDIDYPEDIVGSCIGGAAFQENGEAVCDDGLLLRPGQPGSPALPDLISTADIARVFGRTDRTIRRWIRGGHLRPVRIGRSVFFQADEIHALISGAIEAALPDRFTVGGKAEAPPCEPSTPCSNPLKN